MTNDRASDTTNSGTGTSGNEQSTSTHHSESTTVTPSLTKKFRFPLQDDNRRDHRGLSVSRAFSAMAKKIMPETFFQKFFCPRPCSFMLTATTTLASSNAVAQMSASDSMSRQDDSVQTSARHHYQSPAERAKDDLLVTEVKSDFGRRRGCKRLSGGGGLRPWPDSPERCHRIRRRCAPCRRNRRRSAWRCGSSQSAYLEEVARARIARNDFSIASCDAEVTRHQQTLRATSKLNHSATSHLSILLI